MATKYKYNIYDKLPTYQEMLLAEQAGRVNISINGNYAVVKYSQTTTHSLDWDDLTIHARGIVYDINTEEIIFLPFKKFFNHLENGLPICGCGLPSTGIEQAEIYEKLDGSCGAIWYDSYDDALRVSTPGSTHSDQALWATNWLRSNKILHDRILKDIKDKRIKGLVTEIIYPGSTVVVKYDDHEQGLHLLAAQIYEDEDEHIVYAPYLELKQLADSYGMPHANIYSFNSVDAIKRLLNEASNLEGFVLCWPYENKRIKMKATEYILMHRIISNIHPKRIDETIFNCNKNASFQDVYQSIHNTLAEFPEEHKQPYQEAVLVLGETYNSYMLEAKIVVEQAQQLHTSLTGPAFFKACSQDIKQLDGVKQMIAFSLLRNTPHGKAVADRIWKKEIRPKYFS